MLQPFCSCRSAGNCKCCQHCCHKSEEEVSYPYRVDIQPIFRPKEDIPCGNLETIYYQDDEAGWMPLLSQANVPDADANELALLSVLSVSQFRFNGFSFRKPNEDPDDYWIQEAKMTFNSFLERMTANVANGSLNAMPTATTAPVVNSMDRDGASIKTGVKASSVQLSSPAPQHESKKKSVKSTTRPEDYERVYYFRHR